jgi:thiol:disulfide interchange protein
LGKGFEYIGIPTFFFLDKNAKEKYKVIGGSKAKIFLQRLKGIQ